MARLSDDPVHQHERYEALLRNLDGAIVIRSGSGTYNVNLPNGSTTQYQFSEFLQTVDGVSWSPHMLQGQDPVLLACCNRCRRPPLFERPSHGLCTQPAVKRCARCHEPCCPRHQRRCTDRRIRCINCARWFRVRRFLRPLFFERVREP